LERTRMIDTAPGAWHVTESTVTQSTLISAVT